MKQAGPQNGAAGLAVRMVAGQSAVTEAWCANPVKLLTPRPRGSCVWACLASYGGGFVAGDQTKMTLRLDRDARCFLTTQASTKIYRNPTRLPCGHRLTAHLGEGALLILAPDPVQSFAGSRYEQRQEFHLQPGAGLALLDWFTAGRAARGERWSFQRLATRNEIFLGGERVLFDSMLLDAAHGPLDGPHRLGRFHTVALIVLAGVALREDAARILQEISARPIQKRSPLAVSASPMTDGVIVRVAGESHEETARFVGETLAFADRFLIDDRWRRKLN